MLVTSRETKRWVLPKGWPMAGLGAAQAAAREALEEAGIKGRISSHKIGGYRYSKRLKRGNFIDCSVDVYALHVMTQRADWPEKRQRVARWFHSSEAAQLVAEPELASLIKSFAAGGYMRCA